MVQTDMTSAVKHFRKMRLACEMDRLHHVSWSLAADHEGSAAYDPND